MSLRAKTEEVIDVNELNILGTHNYENVMAAVAMTISIGVPLDVIVKTLREFQAVEHRIEYVTEKRWRKISITIQREQTRMQQLREFRQ